VASEAAAFGPGNARLEPAPTALTPAGGMSEAELAVVRRWRSQVSADAVQEMPHFALVQNLLSAVGAARLDADARSSAVNQR